MIGSVFRPVGAGKSTYAAQLSLIHAAPRLNLDEWIVTLFVPDRPSADVLPWYLERNKAKSATFRMHVPEEMFKLASSLWQAPDEIECNQRDIQFITT